MDSKYGVNGVYTESLKAHFYWKSHHRQPTRLSRI
jgi:hypothetical protein